MKKVAAVVVTYNRLELLKKNIEALKQQSADVPFDILIIDNASTDHTKDYVTNLNDSTILYYNTGKNIGGAGGFNYGIRKAVESGYDWIWLMDDDTIPTSTSLSTLIQADKKLDGKYGFLCSRVLWKDGTQCLMNCPKYKLKKVNQDTLQNDLTQVTQASFVSLFLSRQTVLEVGLPIKEFFIWGDDVEYTRRISLEYDKKSYIIKDSIVYHYMKTNQGSNIALDIVERIARYRYAYRNEFYLYKKSGLKGFAYYLAKCLYNFLRILLISKDNKAKRIKVLYNAICEGANFNPKIEKLQ